MKQHRLPRSSFRCLLLAITSAILIVAAVVHPLVLTFDAGGDGIARHNETMRVNLIARRTTNVDGKLDDWNGVLPQLIDVAGDGDPSFEEAMLCPFQRFESQQSEGVAVGYVAHDDDHFYFAAKIADGTTDEGTYSLDNRGVPWDSVSRKTWGSGFILTSLLK